jgi:hypothetical protein
MVIVLLRTGGVDALSWGVGDLSAEVGLGHLVKLQIDYLFTVLLSFAFGNVGSGFCVADCLAFPR